MAKDGMPYTKGESPSPTIVYDDESKGDESDIQLRNRHYEPPDEYESKHRSDPQTTWTAEEEKKLYRRVDVRVALVACVCFGSLCLDRSNLGNALSDNFLKDLGMTTADYNKGSTIFYVCFLAAEVPSQLISKKLGSDRWIPIQMMAWSLITLDQTGLSGRASFFATRALLGLFEGGFIADTVLYLSYYYTAAELTIRLAWFYVASTVTGIIGNLLAAGLLELRHRTSWPGYRWLFLVEGLLTFLIGLWAFFYLPPGPTQTAGGFFNVRGKGWFTDREETIIVNKVLRDDPTKSNMHNREGLSLGQLWETLRDYDQWPMYPIALLFCIAPAAVGAYFSLTLKSLGYTTFQTNMLQIPYQVVYIFNNLVLSYSSRRARERFSIGSLSSWYALILFIPIVLIPDATNKWAKWALLSLVMATPFCHPIMMSTVSANAGSVRTRTVASALYNTVSQAGLIIASNVYQPSDAPYYHKGNRGLIGVLAANIVCMFAAKAWYAWRNRQRDKVWGAWSADEKEEYLRTTTDEGNKRLDFRFVH